MNWALIPGAVSVYLPSASGLICGLGLWPSGRAVADAAMASNAQAYFIFEGSDVPGCVEQWSNLPQNRLLL